MRHDPTLHPHPEQEPDVADDEEWKDASPRHHQLNSPSSSSTNLRTRLKPRSKTSFPSTSASGGNGVPAPATSAQPYRYPDVYSQFVLRYKSQPGLGGDVRNDPDSHYLRGRLGHLVDAGDPDGEDVDHASLVLESTPSNQNETESSQSPTAAQKERLEWQNMLASVLSGDVLRSEKTRIAVALDTSAERQNKPHANLWLGIRAKLHGWSEEEERKKLEERRLRTVDAIIEEIMTFRVDNGEAHDSTAALKQVNAVLHRLDFAQSFYPTLKAFYIDKPAARDRAFQARCDALNTWSTVLTALRHHLAFLRHWTGSETLDITQPNTTAEVLVNTSHTDRSLNNGPTEISDRITFVERVLKEDSIQRTFGKGFLVTVYAFIGSARDAHVNLASLFKEMNLPTFEQELVPLISFPTRLVQASLKVRLDYVRKLQDPEMIIDQIIEDLKLNIGLACTLKRQYEVLLTPDLGGNWNLPQCISDDYDSTILEALRILFKLIYWKLKSGTKRVYFKETDVLEAHWATFNDVSLTAAGGSSLVAEQLCALINKLMVRVTGDFETQVRAVNGTQTSFHSHLHGGPSTSRKMTNEEIISWYDRILDGVRPRYRKLLRFARLLIQRFSNSAEYSLEDVSIEHFIASLVATDHFLVYTQSFEEDGTYIIAPSILHDRHATIRRMLTEAFHVNEVVTDEGIRVASNDFLEEDYDYDVGGYVLLLSPRSGFLWNGPVLVLAIPKVELDMKDNRVRLIADGPQRRLALAKQSFDEIFVDDEGEAFYPELRRLSCLVEQQAHLPTVQLELREIARVTNRLAEAIVDSVHHVRGSLGAINGSQDLLENWYAFASEHGQHEQKYMEPPALHKFNQLLIGLAISWVSFICDDCDPSDRNTFKWAVNALEFTSQRIQRNNILHLPDDQFEMLRQRVATCMTLLISHFDILGARSNLEAKREKERQEALLRQQAADDSLNDEFSKSILPAQEEAFLNLGPYSHTDAHVRTYWEKVRRSVLKLEKGRSVVGTQHRTVGRVLDDEKPEDRTVVFLASSSSNILIRWQQGRFIGAGSFGSVYLANNLDSGSLMAVKEIKFQELSGLPNLIKQIKEELSVMEMLHHPNVVEYYGIELHRDKVYIFEEYCSGGSLAASLLEHGRIEDESVMQAYTMQLLEGLAYLHSKGIAHRDIKPDNILLDHLGVIKFVDFGAAKILAKNQRSLQRTRRGATDATAQGSGIPALGGPNVHNSLTGTPMYMSPEVIKNDKRGRHGAMDIWSLGCVVLEIATGKKPWSNLDNEWAIMFHIGVATQHPPLPEPGQMNERGINFIQQCLTIDPVKRPSAVDLLDHAWMLEFREALFCYEEAENASRQGDIATEEPYQSASMESHSTVVHEKGAETLGSLSPGTS